MNFGNLYIIKINKSLLVIEINIMQFILYIIFFLFSIFLNAQSKFYSINFYEGRSYSPTSNQINDIVLNSIRIVGAQMQVDSLQKKEKTLYSAGMSVFTSLFGQVLTHEEGHRSVLTELGIGSINSPIFDRNLVAKVTGVNNETLINLRNNNLSNYIRLHSAGLESDYTYLRKSDAFFNFGEESYSVLFGDYIARKLGITMYYLTNIIPIKMNIKEQDVSNELERDIVGHDLYGMIRHLHRPQMEFYRYTEWKDLTGDEKKYATRMGLLSLANLINPNLIMRKDFKFSKNIKMNFSMNYSLAPFGDFIEQNIYLKIHNKININPYLRQYFNQSHTFLATGLNLHNLKLNQNRCLLNANIDIWNQPKNQQFETATGAFGFAIGSSLAYQFSKQQSENHNYYAQLGANYKTIGFLPGSPSLNDDFRLSVGLVISSK